MVITHLLIKTLGDPMEAFNAAGEFINDAMESEFTKLIKK